MQAVRVGDRIECSGQGGWDSETGEFAKDVDAQTDLAFENVDRAIKSAGGKGAEQKWLPNHKLIWTYVGVARLALDEMLVEIEVGAYDPKD